MATTTKYNVGLKFDLDSGRKYTKTFSGVPEENFTDEKINAVGSNYKKIVAGEATQRIKTTVVTTDIG